MTKADIATHIHERADIPEGQALELLEWILDLMKSTLQRGEEIKIVGLGRFLVRSKKSRTGRNPRTGEEITISPRRVATFQASALFKEYVNGSEPSSTEQSTNAEM